MLTLLQSVNRQLQILTVLFNTGNFFPVLFNSDIIINIYIKEIQYGIPSIENGPYIIKYIMNRLYLTSHQSYSTQKSDIYTVQDSISYQNLINQLVQNLALNLNCNFFYLYTYSNLIYKYNHISREEDFVTSEVSFASQM